jgi:hypothetical protein
MLSVSLFQSMQDHESLAFKFVLSQSSTYEWAFPDFPSNGFSFRGSCQAKFHSSRAARRASIRKVHECDASPLTQRQDYKNKENPPSKRVKRRPLLAPMSE